MTSQLKWALVSLLVVVLLSVLSLRGRAIDPAVKQKPAAAAPAP